MELRDTLKLFRESGEDWERKQTSIKGVSIIRLPATRSRPASLAIEINPLGDEGLPMKKRGVMVMSSQELVAFSQIFRNEKLKELVDVIEETLPEKRRSGNSSRNDVVEI